MWETQNWKIIISQRLSHRNESSEPTIRLPHWASDIRRRNPQSTGLWRLVGLECKSFTDRRTQRPDSWRMHTKFNMHGDPGQSSDSMGTWTGPNCWSWRVSQEGRDWLWLTVGARTVVADAPGIITQCALSGGLPLWHQDLVPCNTLWLQCWVAPGRAATGWAHSHIHQQTGCL